MRVPTILFVKMCTTFCVHYRKKKRKKKFNHMVLISIIHMKYCHLKNLFDIHILSEPAFGAGYHIVLNS